ncbi:phosphomannose isomerase type II C-terminal cupin domain [Chitinivibrio alkaliphilus]|uniref:phosphomannose isomerase type II C-terminal cupin domain n=1 Tax=Chitinivibrio alkaliphilus TaxID=1505232 RepID=UPI00041426E9|nr:phosphomannose isomerase type II C-terminal cupin domain [Chitinivibrio alkaliphilus]
MGDICFTRPWGTYTILEDSQAYKVKRINVLPGKRLSLQSHSKRDELWTMVQGEGVVTLDGLEITFTYGKTIDIHRGQKHRITNTGSLELIFIEVQTGEYFGEDDIVRYEDDFGRV